MIQRQASDGLPAGGSAVLPREIFLARLLNQGIGALQRGEPADIAWHRHAPVAPLLEVAEALIERGRRARLGLMAG